MKNILSGWINNFDFKNEKPIHSTKSIRVMHSIIAQLLLLLLLLLLFEVTSRTCCIKAKDFTYAIVYSHCFIIFKK
jgi:hypothetical protein